MSRLYLSVFVSGGFSCYNEIEREQDQCILMRSDLQGRIWQRLMESFLNLHRAQHFIHHVPTFCDPLLIKTADFGV